MRWVMEALMELPDHPVYTVLILAVAVGSMLTFVMI